MPRTMLSSFEWQKNHASDPYFAIKLDMTYMNNQLRQIPVMQSLGD